jgi:hypothetical protein
MGQSLTKADAAKLLKAEKQLMPQSIECGYGSHSAFPFPLPFFLLFPSLGYGFT